LRRKREDKSIVNSELHSSHSNFLNAYFANASKEELLELFLKHLKEEHTLTDKEINAVLGNAQKHYETLLPVEIFRKDTLSALESIVKYLKENKELTFHQIAQILNRDDRTIWTTYSKARKKMIAPFHLPPSKHYIPAALFAERNLSVLETLAHYLKEHLNLSLHEIAVLLNRNDRTIWTVCNRASKKLKEVKP
jgi:predicted DNA-binding protein (UPF0251 family)